MSGIRADSDRVPSRNALIRAAEAMRLSGDMRSFIHLVEAWRSVGEVPETLQLAQVDALLDLCQTDRAWVRLKDLVESEEPSDRALKLAARMFIQRGWPGRARLPLQTVVDRSPGDEEAQDLLDQAGLPVVSHDDPPPDSTSVGLLLPMAEALLSQGNRLKGHSLLQRLRRAHPEHPRVADLLWALDTDWSIGGADLAALIMASDTATPVHPRFEDDDAEPTFVELEPNPVTLIDDDSDEDSDFTFPALFRDGTQPLAAHDGTPIGAPRRSLFDDVTQSTNLADLEALNDAVGAARRAAGLIGGDEFTEIRRIIRRPDGTPEPDETVDSTIPDTHFHTRSTDVSTPRNTGHSLDVDVEAEDDALIIVTKRERDDGNLEILELDPNTESVAHPDAARFLAEAQELDRKAEEEALQNQKRAERERAIAQARSNTVARRAAMLGLTPAWIIAILALFFVVMAMFALLIVVFVFR